MLFYYNSDLSETPREMSSQISKFVHPEIIGNRQVIVLCIGSDRSTGDSLGPLIGYKLIKSGLTNVTIYGSLKNPVHATNLNATIDEIYNLYNNPYVIAIDASLGKKDHIGCITLGTGALKPGLGVKKQLPEVGDIHITGIVNLSGAMDTLLLQTTRLSTIMTLADVISEALINSLN
ncbi:spore protease YyaC [[Clostridium] fimetarium]|uniref:Putative sporulation protein YyaC n=1 Tax=[Clostridium] fimetarium TaxID=99656 RepID=A0A1I0RCY9_9FIRM|nr:spore protease YyaC [[Clostridium] fimetarium]SEW38589.1 putative sporulation protein YyaC [[Clostridium] fimetarium]